MSPSQQLTIEQALSKAKKAAKQGNTAIAVKLYNAILQKQPNHSIAKKGLRKLQEELSQNQIPRTQDIQPNPIRSPKASAQEQWDALVALYNQGRFQDVVTQTTFLLKQFPQAIILHNIQGASNAGLHLFEAAIENYQRAILINPDYFEAHNNMGNALKNLGNLTAAIESYNRAIEINPDYAEAHNNLSMALLENGDSVGAIESSNRSVEINPNSAEAHSNLGNALQQIGDPVAAIKSYTCALEIQPDFELARSHKLRQQAFICDWGEIEADRRLIPDLGVSRGIVTPFSMLYLEDDAAHHLKRSELFAQAKCKGKDTALAPIARPSKQPKLLKIGYFSGDFHSHPVMRLIVKMLALHNKSHYEIHAFSFGPKIHDDMREKLVNNVDAFHDVHGKTDHDIAKLARTKSIDIAVDLSGYTQNSRWGILACRPAPIQVSYLGYPGSMGANFIDYIIADPILIPEENHQFFSEKIVYMPHCYQVSDNSRVAPQVNVNRAALGLPEVGFVFCCLSTNYKITPREFDVWMRLLHEVKGSVLWLAQSNQWSEVNLKKEAQARGLDAKRLIFAGQCQYSEYLARLTNADLFLDTFNFNAGAIANDALWCGLPIVTMQGQSYSARMVSSLLNTLDLSELITTTESDYEKVALDLATNSKKLKLIKAKLAISKNNTPLFDTKRFTRNIERAYTQMYTKYFAGEKLEPLFIKEYKIH
jgi:predicted O-linked N-acetylglucosamine transferase (SPINDLY family)